MPLQNRVMVCIHCGNISGSRERFFEMMESVQSSVDERHDAVNSVMDIG